MLLSPPILALILVSLLSSLMLLFSGGYAWKVVRHWNIGSGSEQQLQLERSTYLISTIVAVAFIIELVALLLFIYNAEAMSDQFVGAMCATGVLNINAWGWPTLFLKLAIFATGTAWLTLNYLDNKGFDYPLVKAKYFALLLITPLVCLEAYTQLNYFLQLNPDVITSCCGSLFTPEAEGVAAEVSSMTPRTAMTLLYSTGLATLLAGGLHLWRGSLGLIFSLTGLLTAGVAFIAIISYIAIYVYEHPHHHCPFCLLKSGHDYAGYLLYIPLFLATAMSIAAGITATVRKIPSLSNAVDSDNIRFVRLALISFALFYALASFYVINSNLVLDGVW